ncbi:hypothetical protein [Tabrizicola sp.]|uniref:hypothetical protein n=1 Tax=Tabrizicola sp. TaxID=2005166 RepID=UPI00273256BB|nr:hypothetical protein [Tabrizicola sp.]MDP3195489.1 hypothetical protein [Tabrizicola sp.]MDZ4065713.1 hypothetical protein [Tabrizicola sp.]
MTRLTIPALDHLGVRVFQVVMSPEDLQGDKARLVPVLLGDPDLDPAYVEMFDVADLSDIGLAGYLTEGLGVPDTALSADHAKLKAIQGPVLILLSKALHGREVTLTLDPRLSLIGTYREDRPAIHFEPLPTAAAEGVLSPPPLPAPPPQRPILAFVLLGLALALVALAALWLALV